MFAFCVSFQPFRQSIGNHKNLQYKFYYMFLLLCQWKSYDVLKFLSVTTTEFWSEENIRKIEGSWIFDKQDEKSEENICTWFGLKFTAFTPSLRKHRKCPGKKVFWANISGLSLDGCRVRKSFWLFFSYFLFLWDKERILNEIMKKHLFKYLKINLGNLFIKKTFCCFDREIQWLLLGNFKCFEKIK